jgi:hypothetical protein
MSNESRFSSNAVKLQLTIFFKVLSIKRWRIKNDACRDEIGLEVIFKPIFFLI